MQLNSALLTRLSSIPSLVRKGHTTWKAECLAFNRDFNVNFEIFDFMEAVKDVTGVVREMEGERKAGVVSVRC